jgi:D-alanyl-D-alanine carboxypeptidase
MTGSGGMRRSVWTLKHATPWLILMVAVVASVSSARAQVGSDRYASIVIDAKSGDLMSAANADEPRYPASLTKMMTIYMLFEALRDRRVSLSQMVPISPHAAAMMPSKLGLVPGTAITVEQGLLGLVTKSANDAASALGELLGGDEDRFAQMMTLRARALGMSHTTFRNASGWPDPDQVTTARDLSVLARHLIQDYPVEYRYFSTPNFVFHGRVIWNHDRMLQSYPGADGLKTGYTEASGCNLVTSAVRGDVRLIGVVMGASNGSERDAHMASLLDAGFDQMGVPVSRGEPARQRFPTLVAQASAATLPASTLPQPRRLMPRTAWARAMESRAEARAEMRAPVTHLAVARNSVRLREPIEPAPPRGSAEAREHHLAAASKLRPRSEPAPSRLKSGSAAPHANAASIGGWARTRG